MRQRPLGQRMASHATPRSQWELAGRPTSLSIITVNSAFIKANTIRSGCPSSWLLFALYAHGAPSPVMLSLVETFESVGRRMKDRLCKRNEISAPIRKQFKDEVNTPVGIVAATDVGNGDRGPQTLFNLASSSLRRSSLAIRSACSNCVAWSSFSSSKTRQMSSREAKGY